MNDTPERWLPIPGYEGIYDVSDLGRVRSWAPWRDTPVPRQRRFYVRPTGHLAINLCNNGDDKSVTVHRLVMLAFVGPKPNGLETRHLDGDPTNNRLTNLVYGTHSENMYDRVRHGTDHQTRKTHCPYGHPYDDANTLHRKRGGRTCIECKRARSRAYDAAKRAA